jgi:hypothetical protein
MFWIPPKPSNTFYISYIFGTSDHFGHFRDYSRLLGKRRLSRCMSHILFFLVSEPKIIHNELYFLSLREKVYSVCQENEHVSASDKEKKEKKENS